MQKAKHTQPKTVKRPSTKHQLLVDLAIKGARYELAQIEERRVTLAMFLKGVE